MSSDKTLYQALIVEEVKDSEASKFNRGIRTELWTRAKDCFPDPIREGLPSNGAMLEQDFLPVSSVDGRVNEENLAKRSSVGNLLQYRKMSQLVAKSWLPEGGMIRKLILTAGLAPDAYDNVIPSESLSSYGIESKQFEEKTTGIQSLYKLAQEIQASANPTLEKKLPQTPTPIDKRTLSYRSSIILPDGLNWQYIRLSLLCAGQAYLKTDENDYQRINEPIMSTYDICVNYAFTTVSWSEYIATSAELV